jgi:hypothetical protein
MSFLARNSSDVLLIIWDECASVHGFIAPFPDIRVVLPTWWAFPPPSRPVTMGVHVQVSCPPPPDGALDDVDLGSLERIGGEFRIPGNGASHCPKAAFPCPNSCNFVEPN